MTDWYETSEPYVLNDETVGTVTLTGITYLRSDILDDVILKDDQLKLLDTAIKKKREELESSGLVNDQGEVICSVSLSK